MSSSTDFNPDYVRSFGSAKAFIDHYRGLHKYPEKHPKAGQVNMSAASNQATDFELIEVYKSVHEPVESEIDHAADAGSDEE